MRYLKALVTRVSNLYQAAVSQLTGRDYFAGDVLQPSAKRIKQFDEHVRLHGRVLDMGTGSGVLSQLAFAKGATAVVAVDINPQAVAKARKRVPQAEVYLSDLFEKVDGQFDDILFSSPWSKGDTDWLPHLAIFDRGISERFLRDARAHLAPNGNIWIQYSDACTEYHDRFLKHVKAFGYRIEGSWSYETWDQLTHKHANQILYHLRLAQP